MKSRTTNKQELTHAECLFKVRQLRHDIVTSLVAVIHALDPYTRDHSLNVANYALVFAETLGLPPAQVQLMHYAGLFHDLGKIGISPDILRKQGALTKAEYALIKEHPTKGARIIEPLSEFASLVPIILHHHERMDGKGYPAGLAGDQIPLGARLIAIVDAYDALTTNRSYRTAQGKKRALEVLRKATPDQFDPDLMKVFLRVAKVL